MLPENENNSLINFESPRDWLGSIYEAAMQAIEDVGIRNHVMSLFQGSGFIYETTDLLRQGHGLVVANSGQTHYIVRFDGQDDNTSPYVTLMIDDPSKDSTASIPLISNHPLIEGKMRGWTKRVRECLNLAVILYQFLMLKHNN